MLIRYKRTAPSLAFGMLFLSILCCVLAIAISFALVYSTLHCYVRCLLSSSARVVSAQPPCIPYVEPYMTQLHRIHAKRPDQLEGGLINFKKKRELASLILEFQLFQTRQPYCYEMVPIVSEFLRKSLESSPPDVRVLLG